MANASGRKRRGDPVLLKIDAVRRSAVLWAMGWGYLWVVLMVTAMVFGGVLLDHAFVLQKWGRLAFFRAFVCSLGASVLVASLFPVVRRMGRLYVARRMEAERPELRNALISYLQCRGDPGTPRELKLLLGRKAEKLIRPLDTRVAVDRTGYVRLGVAVCVLMALFLLYLVFAPKSSAVSLRRLFLPRTDILPPTATRLSEITPGDMYVITGDEPRLKVKVDGVRPRGVYAVWDGAGFEDRRILLSEKRSGLWEGRFPPVLSDGSYHVAAGDTRSDRFGIHVLPRPAVRQVTLTLRPPAYTGLPVRRVNDGSAEVIAGTEVSVRALTNLPPQSGYLQFDVGRRIWMRAVEGESALEAAFTALRSDAYSVHFESVRYPDGSSFANLAPVKFTIVCREDRAPQVTLHAPPDGIQLSPSDTAPVTYSVRDDFRVTRVRLRYSVGGLASPAIPIAEPDARKLERAVHEWDLSGMPVRGGAVIVYYVEAEDNWPEVPHVGRSETRRIVVVGPKPERREEPPEAPREGRRQEPDEPDVREPAEAPAEPQTAPTSDRDEGAGPEARRAEKEGERPGATPPEQQPREVTGDAEEERKLRLLEDYARRIAELLGPDQGRRDRAEGVGQGQAPRVAPAQDGISEAAAAGRQGEPSGAARREGGPAGTGESGVSEPRRGVPPAGAESQTAAGPADSREAPAGQGEPQPGRAAGAPAADGSEAGQKGAGTGGAPAAGEGSAAGSEQAGQEGSGPGAAGASGGGGSQAAGGTAPAGQAASAPGGGAAGSSGMGVSQLPPDGPPEGPLDRRLLDNVVEEVAQLLDGDRLPQHLLDDLGTNRQKLRAFVERYREQRAQQRSREAAPEPGQAEFSEAVGRVIQAIGPAAGGMGAKDALPARSRKDALRSRFEGAGDRLSPRYRDVVDRYYKAVSEEL